MNTRINKIIAFALILAFGPVVANAAGTEWTVASGGNGNFYEVITANGITWDAANTAAQSLTHDESSTGVPGHLATITSLTEDAHIHDIRNDVISNEAWVGGFQTPCVPTPSPGCGWEWVNGEGPFPGMNSMSPYANWTSGEPNNLGGSENHLGVGHGNVQSWNDEANTGNIGAFIVEYDVASRFVPPGPGGVISDGASTGFAAKYTNVLEGGHASINCCVVLDTREHSGNGKKHGDYDAINFDLGYAIDTTPGCAALRTVGSLVALLQPWHRGVPQIKEGEAGHLDTDHKIGVCKIVSDTVSQGVWFSAENTLGHLGYEMDCSEPQIDYRPFTGAVALGPDAEGDAPYVTRISADCDASRSAKKGSTNLVSTNLWHYIKGLNTKPYLVGMYDTLLESIEDEKMGSCVDNREGFVDNLESYVQAARAFTGKKGPGAQKAVNALDDATRLLMLIDTGPRPIPVPLPADDPYMDSTLCNAANLSGLWIGRVMALKFGVCSELQHKFTNSSSSVDGDEQCVIEQDILDVVLPQL